MRSLFPKRFLSLSALSLLGAFSISACDPLSPEYEVRLCVDGGVTQDMVRRLADIASRHRLSFDDSGAENKEELITISAENSIIPTGVATNLLVKDGRTVVLVGTNFGSTGELLILSFFNMKDDDRRSSFKRDILAEVARMPNSTVVHRGSAPDSEISCPGAPMGAAPPASGSPADPSETGQRDSNKQGLPTPAS